MRGYDQPLAVVSDGLRDARLFIVEQAGIIKVAKHVKGGWKKAGTFLDLSRNVSNSHQATHREEGLLGLAFAPDYATSRAFYVVYTRRTQSGVGDGDTVLAEFHRTDADHADPTSRRIVMIIPQPTEHHHGGDIAFGPDGHLYLGTGDGGPNGDPHAVAQDTGSLLGKFLRIDPRDPDGAGPLTYSVPADNPYAGDTPGLDEIWAYGFRNPWRWSFDSRTGDLWIGDVGQCRYEEIDHVTARGGVDAGKGLGFGWSLVEGLHTYIHEKGHSCDTTKLCSVDCQTLPVRELAHADGACAVIGGYVYRGTRYPAWDGYYVFGDLCSGKLTVLDRTGAFRIATRIDLPVSSFGQDPSGRLYVTGINGAIGRVTFEGSP